MSFSECIFCRPDRELIAQTSLSMAFFDRFAVAKGHALIVPRRHLATIWDMSDEEYADAFALVRTLKALLSKQFEPDGFNVGVNCGEAAGQSVWHAHIHVIPRYAGDVPDPRGGVRNVIPRKTGY